jgi:hypothetical protein
MVDARGSRDVVRRRLRQHVSRSLHLRRLLHHLGQPLHSPVVAVVDVNATTFPALWGRPLLGLSLKINYALGGYNVVGYHLFNLLVHILNAMLAFGILRRTLVNLPQR